MIAIRIGGLHDGADHMELAFEPDDMGRHTGQDWDP